MQKSNLGIFQQYAEEIDLGDCNASYINYPNFEKAVNEILQREKVGQFEQQVIKKNAEVTCEHCGWEGKEKELVDEYYNQYNGCEEVLCPRCKNAIG